MTEMTPLRDKVVGQLLEQVGDERTTQGGVVLTEKNLDESSIRSRWFRVTHVGPEQKDVQVGDFVLMPHGRWSRGIDIEGTYREEDKFFQLDPESILGKADKNPLE